MEQQVGKGGQSALRNIHPSENRKLTSDVDQPK